MGASFFEIILFLAICSLTILFRKQISAFFGSVMRGKDTYRVNMVNLRCPVRDKAWPEWANFCTVGANGAIRHWEKRPTFYEGVWTGSGVNLIYSFDGLSGNEHNIWSVDDPSTSR